MKILGIDIEGKFGVMSPHMDGFYTSCVGMVWFQDGLHNGEDIVWFDHNHIDRTPGGVKLIQNMVDWSDLIVGQNLKYDIKALTHYGVNFDHVKIWDTMLAEYILSGMDSRNRKYGLNALSGWYKLEGKGEAGDKVRAYWDNRVETADIPVDILSEYQINDCIIPIRIYEKQIEIAKKEGILANIELQNEWLLCLMEMEYNGMGFDKERALKIVEEYKTKADEVQDYFRDLVKQPHLNLGSDIQKSALVYGGLLKTQHKEWVIKELKIRPESTYKETNIKEQEEIRGLGFPLPRNKKKQKKNGYWKVAKGDIEILKGTAKNKLEWKAKLLEHSKYTNIHQALVGKSIGAGLVNKLARDGLIHPTLDQMWARTGRLTSKNPNGQNLFPIVKECFIPTLDYIGQIDLSQVEWRAAGELADDQVIINEVNGGVDQHIATVTELMDLPFLGKDDPASKANRNHAKTFNFRMIFGGTEWGYHLDVDMPRFGLKKWKEIIDKFWRKYFALYNFHSANIQKVLRDGFVISKLGRRFRFDKCKEVEGELTYNYNQIKNRVIQGSAAELIALLGVVTRRGMKSKNCKSKMIITVHDSIVFDIKEGEEDYIKWLTLKTAKSLREYIKAYWGVDWRVQMDGEFEFGINYKSQHEVKLDQKCKEVLK